MTLVSPDRAAEMSVVNRRFDTKKEVNPMTSAAATDLDFVMSSARDGFTRHARPSALDRAIMRLSVAMLRWARNHADRSFLSWDERTLANRNALDREARENAASLGPLRVL
jgi:hypothetical protein